MQSNCDVFQSQPRELEEKERERAEERLKCKYEIVSNQLWRCLWLHNYKFERIEIASWLAATIECMAHCYIRFNRIQLNWIGCWANGPIIMSALTERQHTTIHNDDAFFNQFLSVYLFSVYAILSATLDRQPTCARSIEWIMNNENNLRARSFLLKNPFEWMNILSSFETSKIPMRWSWSIANGFPLKYHLIRCSFVQPATTEKCKSVFLRKQSIVRTHAKHEKTTLSSHNIDLHHVGVMRSATETERENRAKHTHTHSFRPSIVLRYVTMRAPLIYTRRYKYS